jgi:hypothetical protein
MADLDPTLSNDTASQQRHTVSFPIGYYQIHQDYSLNYQMNRFMTGEQSMIAQHTRQESRLPSGDGRNAATLHELEQC